MLIIAILIKLTSRGHIFFKQERMGLDGKTFNMLKFRTMFIDAEQETVPVWTKKDDPRRTKIGKLLRRTSLDELPQFFNVLKGDMSIMGSRPEQPVFIENFRSTIPKYVKTQDEVWDYRLGSDQRLAWKHIIGKTNWIRPVLHWKLVTHFDLKIIWLTVWNGLVNKHAY